MRKMKLEVEQLEVESFETERVGRAAGTVKGNELSAACTMSNYCSDADVSTCNGANTCAAVGGSCPAQSCGDCNTYYCSGPGSQLYVDTICN